MASFWTTLWRSSRRKRECRSTRSARWLELALGINIAFHQPKQPVLRFKGECIEHLAGDGLRQGSCQPLLCARSCRCNPRRPYSITLSGPRRGSFATVGSDRACLRPLQRLQPCYNTQSGTFNSTGICRGWRSMASMALLTPLQRAQLHEISLVAQVLLVLTAAAARAACLAAGRSRPEVQGWVLTRHDACSGRN
jgi:hypothetical protein